MKMHGLKPSVLIGTLKQHLPPGVSPDNYLFLAMFFICLPPSMREVVGAGTHMTAAAMVKAADALWDARGGHNPTVIAASTQRSRSPAPYNRKRGDKRAATPTLKVDPFPALTFIHSRTLTMASVNFTNHYAHKAHRCALPCAWSEN